MTMVLTLNDPVTHRFQPSCSCCSNSDVPSHLCPQGKEEWKQHLMRGVQNTAHNRDTGRPLVAPSLIERQPVVGNQSSEGRSDLLLIPTINYQEMAAKDQPATGREHIERMREGQDADTLVPPTMDYSGRA
jgi:hypothetical protein